MMLSSYLAVAEKLVHAVGFISFRMIKGEKGKNLTVFLLFNVLILFSSTSIGYPNQRAFPEISSC